MFRFPRKKLGRIFARAGIAVLPTDTLYGIVASALSRRAVARVYRLRKRNPKKPLIILIHSAKELELFGITLSHQDRKILRPIWPGKVSVIVPCAHKKFSYLHRGTKTLAFRVPAFPALRRFLAATGPLVSPSANWEGHLPAQTIEEARYYFGDAVDAYVDAGRRTSNPSTIVALENGRMRVVRKGAGKIRGI